MAQFCILALPLLLLLLSPVITGVEYASTTCSPSVYTITFCPAYNNSQVISYVEVNATDTMKPGNILAYPSQLVSEGGNFTLGFFTLNKTGFSYLGIWHTADEQRRKVWIANPNFPITWVDSNVQLVMDDKGSLKILSGQSLIMNVADQARTNNNTIAILQDSGNFVLVDSGAGKKILWQSFDHPTSVLLPGMRVGFNLTTRQNWTLTSWLSLYAAASGAFTWSLERIQESGQFVIRRHGRIYWTSGPWNDQGFRYLPSLKAPSAQFGHKLNFISENDGMYFTFETMSASSSMLELSPEGQIIDHTNGDDILITPYQNFCYGYESDNGCATSEMPNCRGNKDTFLMRSGYFVGNSSFSYDDSSNISLNDCMERCWNNCSCNGFASYSNGTGCTIWTGNPQVQEDQSDKTERVYVLHQAASSPGKSSGRVWIWILVTIAIALPFLSGSICYIKIRKRKREEMEKRRQKDIHQLTAESDVFEIIDKKGKTGKEGHGMKIFSFGSLMTATNAFSKENKLGEGGFGPVYKGKLLDGREIAVKRLSKTSTQGLREFKNELKLIFKLQHTNLVQLLGCCIHEEEKMLIYEYMPNKSLDFFLFAQDKRDELDWQKRFNIIEGVAQGLLYLHKYSRMRVIHRDLKVSNILLDEDMKPKIADFGLARMFKQNETEAITNRVVGTFGYMSPEYAMGGTFSIKSDVFSFGVLVLEIVSGKKNSCFYQFEDYSVNLVGYAWDLWKGGRALELKDPALCDSFDTKQVLRSIHIGLLCVQERAFDRPTMLEVISMLNSEAMNLSVPKEPAFFTGRKRTDANSDIHMSVNEVSISEIEAR